MPKKNQASYYYLKDFTRGWIIGQFSPTLLATKDFEFAVKVYKKNDYEPKHYHKQGQEFSVIIQGKFQMNNKTLEAGEIVVLQPGTPADFLCLEDGATAVIKVPSIPGDKFMVKEEK